VAAWAARRLARAAACAVDWVAWEDESAACEAVSAARAAERETSEGAGAPGTLVAGHIAEAAAEMTAEATLVSLLLLFGVVSTVADIPDNAAVGVGAKGRAVGARKGAGSAAVEQHSTEPSAGGVAGGGAGLKAADGAGSGAAAEATVRGGERRGDAGGGEAVGGIRHGGGESGYAPEIGTRSAGEDEREAGTGRQGERSWCGGTCEGGGDGEGGAEESVADSRGAVLYRPDPWGSSWGPNAPPHVAEPGSRGGETGGSDMVSMQGDVGGRTTTRV
jgi:hypothetical protein